MGMSTTIKTPLGDVTVAARGKCDSVNAGPVVRAAITLHLMTHPLPMSPAQARGLATILLTAATEAEHAHAQLAKLEGVA